MVDAALPRRQLALRGFLQGLQPRKLRGWAFVPARPNEHVKIEIKLDGTLIATAKASQFAQSLQKNGIGKGDHSFVVATQQDLPVDEPDRIEVTAIAAQGETLVLRLSRKPGDPPDPTPPNPAPAPHDPQPAPPPEPRPAPGGPALQPRFLAADHAQRPLFVLGSARSGTSAMVHALRKSTRYVGPPEGHLLDLVPKLLNTAANHYRRNQREIATSTMIAGVPLETVTDGLQNAFAEIIRAMFPAGYWIDKTPGPDMIKAAPAMRRIWPEARFIFMKRRPIENIESRRRKFPTISFRDHCQLWADSMTAWEAVRDDIKPVSVEIEQLHMAEQPRIVAEQVGRLLDLNAKEVARLLQSFETDRPQQTGEAIASVYDLATVGWDPDQRQTFLTICGGPMKRFGYGTDRTRAAGA